MVSRIEIHKNCITSLDGYAHSLTYGWKRSSKLLKADFWSMKTTKPNTSAEVNELIHPKDEICALQL